ncbi:MAG: hypothetical protein CSA10_00305 [Cardiobacteriales bacterium]|nr:MAG: hypothetical protein CSA10_00305 [Cardiobacteriales bacterium]
MNQRQAYHVGLILLLIFTWLFSGWVALHWQTYWSIRQQTDIQLSEQQQAQLATLSSPIVIEAYTRRHPQLQRNILQAIEPVKKLVPDLSIKWINPDTHPIETQKRGITKEGQAYISIGEQGRHLEFLSPKTLVEALLELGHSQRHIVGFTQGNGERALLSDTPGAWLSFYYHFNQAGVPLVVLDMKNIPTIPDNINAIIIANPSSLDNNSEALLTDYLNRGGNLIYTTDTHQSYLPDTLSQQLNLSLYEGVIVDANASKFGFDNPEIQVVELLGDHDITRALKQSPLFAGSKGLNISSLDDWQTTILLWSSENSWNETSPIVDNIRLDADETRGPIALGVIFTRTVNDQPQTIIVLGDSDLWSDTYFNTGGNRQLAEHIFAYFNPNTSSTKLSQQPLTDQFITIDQSWLIILAFILLVVLPLTLFVLSLLRWRRPCL